MSRRLSIIYVWDVLVLVLVFNESPILTVIYVFSFFVVFKMYKPGLQITHLILDNLIFLGSVDIGSYLLATRFEMWILTLDHFLYVFSDP